MSAGLALLRGGVLLCFFGSVAIIPPGPAAARFFSDALVDWAVWMVVACAVLVATGLKRLPMRVSSGDAIANRKSALPDAERLQPESGGSSWRVRRSGQA